MPVDMEVAVGLFPGQGGYRAGCLDLLLAEPESREVLELIDEIALEMFGRRLLDSVSGVGAGSAQELFETDPDMMQVAIFAASVAVFEALRARGTSLSVLIGHSLGEIAALACGGALTISEGTRILCHRVAVLREHDTSGGTMLALACERARAEQVLSLLPASAAAIAGENGPTQVTVSGTAEALRRVELIAGAIGVPVTALRARHPFHNVLLQTARRELLTRIGGHRSHGLRVPVFSPILGRYYREQDDLGELLADHLVTPVEFRQSIDRAYEVGARIWVEVGAGRALTNLVRSAHPNATVFTPLGGREPTIAEAAAFLGAGRGFQPDAAQPAEPQTAQPAPEPKAAPTEPLPTEPVAGSVNGAIVEPINGFTEPIDGPDPEPEARPVAEPVPEQAGEEPAAALSRSEIEQRIRVLYATALEYPQEVFEPEAELEADLGVDSVKQTELMSRLGETFALGPPPQGMRINDYRTFGNVVDFVCGSLPAGSAVR